MTSHDRSAYLLDHAEAYTALALENIDREYPVYIQYVANGPDTVHGVRPRDLHPVFYGSFDWHSCVEMYWVLIRLLRVAGTRMDRSSVITALDRHLTDEAVAGEVRFFADPNHATVERPYGWGWLLRLHEELWAWDTADARRFAARLQPLTDLLAANLRTWAEANHYPNRSGLHGNSAFGLRLALPYADASARQGAPHLREAIATAAERWYGHDHDYPVTWEPSSSDFLSPSLVEAELMSHVLPTEAFRSWFNAFLPDVARPDGTVVWEPLSVPRNPDGYASHLLGLNLSRAWCLNQLAEKLPEEDGRRPLFHAAAAAHAAQSLDRVNDGYMTSHWLVAYAVLYLSES
jgi:hypothetical protein